MTDDRCVICGAKGTSAGVKVTSCHRVARTFNLVWKHLQQKRVDGGRSKNLVETLMLSGGNEEEGGDLDNPTLCEGCSSKILGVEELLKELRVKVGELEELLRRNGGNEATAIKFERVEDMGMQVEDSEGDEQGDKDMSEEDQDDDNCDVKSESESASEEDEEAAVVQMDVDVSMEELDPLADVVGTTVKKPVKPLPSPKGENFYTSVVSLWKHEISEQSEVQASKETPIQKTLKSHQTFKHSKFQVSKGKPDQRKIIRPKGKRLLQECNLCGVQVPFQSILEHVQGHVGIYAQQCPNPSCPWVFGNDFGLMNHLNRKSQECKPKNYQYTCDVCQLTTPSKLMFKAHLQNVHERGSNKCYPCPVQGCQERFGAQKSIPFHLDAHRFHAKRQQTCEKCGIQMKQDKMEAHLKEEHQAQNILKCEQCPFLYLTPEGLVEHLFMHRNSGMWCHICKNGVKYTKHALLRKHYEESHDINVARYTCEYCGNRFFSNPTLAHHVNGFCPKRPGFVKDTRKQKLLFCDKCPKNSSKSYASEVALLSHKIRIHGDEPFTCKICKATFDKKEYLNRHELQHAGVLPAKLEWKCEVEGCGQVFQNRPAFNGHKRIKHPEKVLPCPECGKGFPTRSLLTIHEISKHGKGSFPYACDSCDKRFRSPKEVVKHTKAIHDHTKPFECDICKHGFWELDRLRIHKRKYHPDKKND